MANVIRARVSRFIRPAAAVVLAILVAPPVTPAAPFCVQTSAIPPQCIFVDAGSCNGCEVEIVALNNPIHDIERFGIHFVASPRHADLLLVTGPVSRNMELALVKTYRAMAEPKAVVAVGTCGISGGIFGENYASLGGVDKVLPVDVYVPGCPPRPQALLHGILLAVGRLAERRHNAG